MNCGDFRQDLGGPPGPGAPRWCVRLPGMVGRLLEFLLYTLVALELVSSFVWPV
jgi:hypothetical protein